MSRQECNSPDHRDASNPLSPPVLSDAQCPHTARYESVLNYCTSPTEVTLVNTLRTLHVTLGRNPALSEVQAALSTHPLGARSRDRFRQIVRNVNEALPDPQLHLYLTPDRPFFRFRELVREAIFAWRTEHHQSPTRPELMKVLSERGITISKTSLTNILKDLRKSSPQSTREQFSISRRRIGVTWTEISAAYKEAVAMLKQQGVKRLPCVQDLSRILRNEGFKLSARALEFRMRSCPPSLGITLAPFSDPARDILRTCHVECSKLLGRAPTLKEITKAYNQKAGVKASPDAVWTRIKRLNARTKGKSRLTLSDTRRSGIYDSDIATAIKRLTKEKERAPTFTELRERLLSDLPQSWIREDTLQRRLSRMQVKLTHEYDLKSEKQLSVIGAIRDLSSLLGRRPLKPELLQELQARQIVIAPSELTSLLGTIKKRQTSDFRKSVSLAIPHHLLEQLGQAFRASHAATGEFPSSTELSAQLGWTREGVLSALPFAQYRKASRKTTPVIISDTTVGEKLTQVRDVLLALQGHITNSTSNEALLSLKDLYSLRDFLHGWELPPIPRNLASRDLSIDESILRLELAWIHLVCMHAPEHPLPEELEFEARKYEATLDKTFFGTSPPMSPFQGMAHALIIARFAGRLSRDRMDEILTVALNGTDLASSWGALRVEIQELARQCGFPRLHPRPK